MLKPLSIIPFLLFSIWSPRASAQLYYKAGILTSDDGLSNNNVNCFYKDRTGFVWIGTQNGLNRFDGHSFRIFRPSPSNSISNEVINAITEDNDGIIWTATMGGLNSYDPSRDAWHCLLPAAGDSKDDLPNNIIWDIHASPDGLLWIASDVFEFSSYNTHTGKFTYYDWPSFTRTLPGYKQSRYNSIQKFVRKSATGFWLATTLGLVSLDIKTGEFRLIGAGYSGTVTDLVYDSTNKQVFLSVEKDRFFVYDEKEKSYQEFHPRPEPYPSSRLPVSAQPQWWLAAEKGIVKISDGGRNIFISEHIPQLSGSLLPGGVHSVYRDDTGIRWVATANGIATYDQAGLSSAFLPLLPVSDRAGNNTMGGVYFDERSNSYFVCSVDPALVFVIDAFSGQIRRISADANGRTFSGCNAIKPDYEGNLWLLTDAQVYRYERATGKFILFPMPNQGADAGFRAFIQDAEGNYWFGSYRKGLFYYRRNEKKFAALPDPVLQAANKISALSSDTVHSTIWIGAHGQEVFRYELRTGRLTSSQDLPGLSEMNLANDIITDRRGTTWIATHAGGIFRYDPRLPAAQSFSRFDMQKGLPANNFISLSEDGASTIWLLWNGGISAMDTAGKILHETIKAQPFVFSAYGSDTRIPHTLSFNEKRKELIAGVGGGLLFYSPLRRSRGVHFPVILTSIRTGTRDSLEERGTLLTYHRLPFRFNSVKFSFAGLYYGLPTGIIYEYRMAGYDKDWIRADGSFTASYENLPPGKYHLHVRAKNANGTIAGSVSGFTFNIIPPFWKNWWFICVAFLLFGGIIYWCIYSLLKKLKAEKILNLFSTSLYGQNTIEDICWDTARNCVEKLGFTDCVIYQYEAERLLLVQRAAYGPKNPFQREIYNSIDIPLGRGIVGWVAQTGKAQLVGNTANDPRYIVDDERRSSEITVPVFIDGKVFGVIDSEHAQRHFYTRYHLRILRKIAAICSERIAKYLTEERLRGKIARDLHDEMGSTLTSIHIMCKVAMESGAKEDRVKSYLQKIRDNSSRMLESIGDMVWVINPANDNFEKLTLRLKEFTAEIMEPARINYHFREEGTLRTLQLSLEQRKEIYMIFKEAMTNVVKYSGTQELYITLQAKDNILSMVIEDRGIGFDAGKLFSGNGITNMKTRAEQIGAELKIEARPGSGCSVKLQLALT